MFSFRKATNQEETLKVETNKTTVKVGTTAEKTDNRSETTQESKQNTADCSSKINASQNTVRKDTDEKVIKAPPTTKEEPRKRRIQLTTLKTFDVPGSESSKPHETNICETKKCDIKRCESPAETGCESMIPSSPILFNKPSDGAGTRSCISPVKPRRMQVTTLCTPVEVRMFVECRPCVA